MAAYLFADVDVVDRIAYDDYRKGVEASLAPYGGRFLVRGGATVALEGDWTPARTVILEFPDMPALQRWYASPEYAPLLAIRKRAARSKVLAIEGWTP